MSQRTANQQRAIEAPGNVLVMAGAGTGKTHTLVQRCLARVCDSAEPVSLDRILMVTFTEAAATEMRKRIREELEARSRAEPENQWLAEQLALVDTAQICTLHSFCLRLLQEHFHELGLDPQLTVLAAEQARLLASETLDALLQRHYAGDEALAEAVQQLIIEHGRGWDQPVRQLVLRLYHYTQTLDDPSGWLERELAVLEESGPRQWENWLREGFLEWQLFWLSALQAQPPENTNARKCAEILDALPANPGRKEIGDAVSQILDRDQPKNWLKGKKIAHRDPIKKLFDDAAFLSAVVVEGKNDPLVEDWNWVRPQMRALLQLVQGFSTEFVAAKRSLGAVDFHDLEQYALRLLWNWKESQPTEAACQWRKRLELVFVDEYQDINAAQDRIITALSRDSGPESGNRFLVGDIKQSIYRFRLADPRIFQSYARVWRTKPGHHVISLADNFRSRRAILEFVNGCSSRLMRTEVGGVAYDEEAKLLAGRQKAEGQSSDAMDVPEPNVELHLRFTGSNSNNDDESDGAAETAFADLSNTEKEAWLVAQRLRELEAARFEIWDKVEEHHRPVAWWDMAILLRSPRHKAEGYAKVFEAAGIPLVVTRGGFYDSEEVADWLNLLKLLDNPLQDVPLLAVLRSPLAGLTLDELAVIRLTERRSRFWMALTKFHRKDSKPDSQSAEPILVQSNTAWSKVDRFLKSFGGWRRCARQGSLSFCLETALDETCYEAWLLTQPRGRQRCANLRRLVVMTREFDQFQRQGLFRFLRFVEAQREAEVDVEPALAESANAVQLMSIHQSKGLEFPVVVVADLGKPFNFDDLKGGVILDEQYGLCPMVKPPHAGQRYPSLPYWLAKRRQRREILGEELRLLYVAMTRARDRLILAGTTSQNVVEQKWINGKDGVVELHRLTNARSYLDWLGACLPAITGNSDWSSHGQHSLLSWTIHTDDLHLTESAVASEALGPSSGQTASRTDWSERDVATIRQRMQWQYAFKAAANQAAKASVSALRKRLNEDLLDEARPVFAFQSTARTLGKTSGLTAAEIGTVHHLFLQMASLDRLGTLGELKTEARRLQEQGVLSNDELAALDLKALTAFWTSVVGKEILQQRGRVHRELPFTVRFSASDLAQAGLKSDVVEDEFVVVQGVVDLAVVLTGEIWILDFKTDEVRAGELADKSRLYEPQLKLYALALSRIYRRPVTRRWLHFLSVGETVTLGSV